LFDGFGKSLFTLWFGKPKPLEFGGCGNKSSLPLLNWLCLLFSWFTLN
jgi:hypothetical protein